MSNESPADTVRWYDYTFWIALSPRSDRGWDTWIDLFLLGEVIGPAIDAYVGPHFRWLVHRRWSADGKDGHRLKLSCYCSDPNAQNIDAVILNCRAFRELFEPVFSKLSAHREKSYTFQASDAAFERGERHWPHEIRVPWTTFVCGVSCSYLQMLRRIKEMLLTFEVQFDVGNPDSVANFYTVAEQYITAYWQKFGHTAYLHHLNAIFGHGPVDYPSPNSQIRL